jgi:hypothetical protein
MNSINNNVIIIGSSFVTNILFKCKILIKGENMGLRREADMRTPIAICAFFCKLLKLL